MIQHRFITQSIAFLLALSLTISTYAQAPIYNMDAVHHPVVAKNGMVASQHHEATKVGLEILEKGGNAIDAAVAVGFSLAVVLPRAGNIGGGGFMVIHDADADKTTTVDYREMAPQKAHRDMYLKEDGSVDNARFNSSYLSVGVPGTVAGMIHSLENYGTMSIKEVIAPAIRLASEGFEVTYDLSRILKTMEKRLKRCPETARVFYKADGSFYEHGEIFKQPDLAWSLQQISDRGAAGFYKGELAKRLSSDIMANGGIMTTKDLKKYKVNEADPVWGEYRGYKIASMPPPSSGGVHIIQMLNILEGFPLGFLGHNSAQTIHLMAEAMRLAYADRSEHLGDPGFWDIPVKGLVSKEYANLLREKIDPLQVADSDDVKPGKPGAYESPQTTHFSVIDKDGNVASNTYTLNFSYGTGLVAKGTGILLNNEMGDFSAKPGTLNAFGLIGGDANAVEPGKRPLSSMTPTIIFKDDKPFIALGTPGGSRIITTVLQVILNVIDHGMNIAEATHAARIHHQWYPDKLYHEKILNNDTKSLLIAKGHKLEQKNAMGSMQSIMIKDGILFGASDPRRPDGATLGY